MNACHGNGPDVCCVIDGRVCKFLEAGTVPDRRYACGLLRRLGSWEEVHKDPEYLGSPVAEWFLKNNPGFWCGDWPQNIPAVMADPDSTCCWKPLVVVS